MRILIFSLIFHWTSSDVVFELNAAQNVQLEKDRMKKNPSKRFVAVHRTQFDIFLSFRIEMACEEESAHAHIDSIETFSWVNDNPIA